MKNKIMVVLIIVTMLTGLILLTGCNDMKTENVAIDQFLIDNSYPDGTTYITGYNITELTKVGTLQYLGTDIAALYCIEYSRKGETKTSTVLYCVFKVDDNYRAHVYIQ